MSVERIFENFGVQLKKDLQKSFEDKQKVKSAKHGTPFNENSNLQNSIKYYVKETSSAIEFQLLMADYWPYVDKGRRAGPVSQEGVRKIENWIKIKGIDPRKGNKAINFQSAVKSMAFAVARKISRKGYQGTGFYSKIINDGRLEDLKAELKAEVKKEVVISFKDGNNV